MPGTVMETLPVSTIHEWVMGHGQFQVYYVHLYSRPPSNQLIGIVSTFLQAELVLARRIM